MQDLEAIDNCEDAIESGYLHARATQSRVLFAPANFMQEPDNLIKNFTKRDCVFALAITHHLLLKDHYSIDQVLDRIRNYANKYVYIEFMPKGLLSQHEDPAIPEWYTREWFKKAFEKYFKLLHDETLEINRQLFIGKLA